MSAPLDTCGLLTESWDFDTMNRRAGGHAPTPKDGPYGHRDCHKYCEGYSCGTRSRPRSEGGSWSPRSAKITAWRKAKAYKNRAYLEEKYG